MQVAKIPLQLVEEPPGPLALGRQPAAARLEAPRGAACDRAEDLQVADQRLRHRGVGPWRRVRGVVGDPEHEHRVAEHQLTRRVRPGEVALIQTADLARGEPMRRDRLGEADAVARVGARQRHEVLHGGVRDQMAVVHVLLDGLRQRAHQTEASRDPAHGPIEALRQHVERDAVLLM